MEKPKVKLIGEDGNVFNLLGIVTREMKKNGLADKVNELTEKVFGCGSYEEALSIMGEYVEIN